MKSKSDIDFMRLALKLAKKGKGRCSPNPMVGAVIVKDNEVLATGWHRGPGRDHAEVDALKKLDFKADGATMYVNLEPCVHYGRTGPCAPKIAASGIKRVVIAMQDPNPKVNGRGIEFLRKAGLDVTVGVLQDEAIELNRAFVKHISTRIPWVIMKLAMTLDGAMADFQGRSRYLTGQDSLKKVHRMRSFVDAVMVGINTVIADNPKLTVRLVKTRKHPVRVVLDSDLRIPVESNLVGTADEVPVWVFHNSEDESKIRELESRGVRLFRVGSEKGFLDIMEVLEALGKEDVQSVLVEPGPILSRYLLDRHIFDELHIFYAPVIAGDLKAKRAFADDKSHTIDEFKHLVLKGVERSGEDIHAEFRWRQ